ncbi:MAG: hypothetical protein KGJ23_08480 [Euryarchaeota archaeon]|nr:hypothetical protein [Euryarchaeota archaeon]MDE1836638.1 hypothetical protein [Euryarchaeota archaeon]MDE1879167.1 hypothetical protein [Euryarchaeota archaeon]MDE2044608.1 hypothetical protein [Thermoplasmata archaeon]
MSIAVISEGTVNYLSIRPVFDLREADTIEPPVVHPPVPFPRACLTCFGEGRLRRSVMAKFLDKDERFFKECPDCDGSGTEVTAEARGHPTWKKDYVWAGRSPHSLCVGFGWCVAPKLSIAPPGMDPQPYYFCPGLGMHEDPEVHP